MSAPNPTSTGRASLSRAVLATIIGLLILGAAIALDGLAFRFVRLDDPRKQDWVIFFRGFGYLPTCILAATALWLVDAGTPLSRAARRSWDRALFLFLCPVVAGIAGELVKLLVRRERPISTDGHYVFRAWADQPFSNSGLGFPSSHAVVAFAAAFALCRLFPRATPVWIALALGCSLTRLLDASHFLSDCAGAAILAFTVEFALARVLSPRRL